MCCDWFGVRVVVGVGELFIVLIGVMIWFSCFILID